jgi:hypothetical protein
MQLSCYFFVINLVTFLLCSIQYIFFLVENSRYCYIYLTVLCDHQFLVLIWHIPCDVIRTWPVYCGEKHCLINFKYLHKLNICYCADTREFFGTYGIKKSGKVQNSNDYAPWLFEKYQYLYFCSIILISPKQTIWIIYTTARCIPLVWKIPMYHFIHVVHLKCVVNYWEMNHIKKINWNRFNKNALVLCHKKRSWSDDMYTYIYKVETCTNILRYNTCMSSYPGDRKWTKVYTPLDWSK